MSEAVKCPDCGKMAIKWPTGLIKLSYPAFTEYRHRCACGWKSGAWDERQIPCDSFNGEWRRANGEPFHTDEQLDNLVEMIRKA